MHTMWTIYLSPYAIRTCPIISWMRRSIISLPWFPGRGPRECHAGYTWDQPFPCGPSVGSAGQSSFTFNALRSRQNSPFSQTIFSSAFLDWKPSNLKWYCVIMGFLKSNLRHVIIASDNGLAPNRQQAVIWTSDDLVYRCVYASPGLSEWSPR